ncbi:hypothetical protein JQC67_00265 [Aurantibacter crassamenti]|uniref:hypothetical protein n=1 Tax=Aurantibacter crassamenti TaxID=1837375 RepID=UPI00193AAF05|nr:hypothetical protein [Aurantibacter crassamenti]MBM1104558.1 hypothetical protein [Aurantibacter crassamenti]
MKTNNLFNTLKATVFGICMIIGASLSAQQTTGDVTKQADIDPGTTTTAGAVRVIDNKGTIKYLQSKNGMTMLSNTTNDVTTTTWQLGGTLTDDTFIDVDGNVFGLDGIELITTETASTDATTGSDHGTGTGYTILVRDEATGATKKLLAADLLQSGQESFTATAAQVAYPLTGSPTLPAFSQVWVYRNGAKLIANVDYTVAASTVTLVENDYSIYAGDIVEVQYIR